MVFLLSVPYLQGLRSKGVVPVSKGASFAVQTNPAQQRKKRHVMQFKQVLFTCMSISLKLFMLSFILISEPINIFVQIQAASECTGFWRLWSPPSSFHFWTQVNKFLRRRIMS